MKALKPLFWFICFFTIATTDLFSQDDLSLAETDNLPKVTHFSRQDFQADAQFWTMTRDEEGVLYFGNNDGALIYDGERWQKVELPNNSSVRSLTTSRAGEVYAGGFNELGIIRKDSVGTYNYVSLLNDLELENDKLENLWQVHEFKEYIIFRSFNELSAISGKTVTHISSRNSFLYADVVNEKYYVQDSGLGLMEFDPESMQLNLVFGSNRLNNNEIKAILPTDIENEILLIFKNGQVFKADPLRNEISPWKNIFTNDYQDQVISAIEHNNKYLLGTLSSRIILLTREGEIIRDSPAFESVHNSSILQLHRDGENVWALLNNGLDFIEYDSPASLLFDDASIYDILIEEEQVLLATNKGVFSSNLPVDQINNYNFRFSKIPDLEGQAWSVQRQGGSVLIGHDKGLFDLENGVPQKIGEVDGFWKIIELKDTRNKFLAANYNGLYLVSKSGENWQLEHKIEGFDESTRDILQADEENTFWVCHGFKGVFKLKINDDYTRIYAVDHFTDQNGLASPFNVNVTRWKDDIIFTTNTGIYRFNETTKNFELYESLNQILDTSYNTRKILKDRERIWVVQDDQVGYFNEKEANPTVYMDLFLNLKGSLNRGMESIQPLKNDNVLIGTTTGLYLYDLNKNSQRNMQTKLMEVSYFDKEEIRKLPLQTSSITDLPSRVEVLRFEFAAPEVSPSAAIQYQYLLQGIDENWSSWENTAYKEYTHLPAGEYSFRVRSRDLIGNKGEEASLTFSISPVWYQTTTAYVAYVLLFLLVSVLFLQVVKRKIDLEKSRARIAAQKSKKLLELEIEQLKLEKDKEAIRRDKKILEEDNILKSKELANYTMMLVKKKDVFTQTYQNLLDFRKSLKTKAARTRLQEVLHGLNQHRIGEEYMSVFDVNFEKVHKNFFKELKAINPKLTKRELRLCAFVKMNLTNKEIAPLLNISVRGVETARYRVRKKLDVQENNFVTFLENLTSPEAA